MIRIDENGKMAGTLKTTWSTKNDQGDTVKVNGEVDFTGIDPNECAKWALKQLVIRRQAVERKLDASEIPTSPKLHASQMGLKVVSREEQIQKLMGFGLPRAAAELAIDNPGALAKAVEAVS